MRQWYVLVMIVGLGLSGCKGANSPSANNTAESFDTDTYAVESAVESLSKSSSEGLDAAESDDTTFAATDSSIAVFANTSGDVNADPRIPLCGLPARQQACQTENEGSSFKLAQYDGCRVRGTRLILRGFVRLDFNNQDCSLAVEGNQVNRTLALVADRILGGAVAKSSARHTNYLGEELGGGSVLSRVESTSANLPAWSLEILGKHVQFYNRNARKVADISISTEGEIGVEGSRFQAPNRTVNGGTLRIDHNLAQYTARFSPVNLVFEETCRCPVSGVLKASWTRGSELKAGSIEFLGCGKVKITKGDEVKERELPACQ